MSWFDNLFSAPVKALNDLRSNVWAVILVFVGITLVIHGHENIGSSLITGAFAVFRSSNVDSAPVPPNAAEKGK